VVDACFLQFLRHELRDVRVFKRHDQQIVVIAQRTPPAIRQDVLVQQIAKYATAASLLN